jgi:hypothetical protein
MAVRTELLVFIHLVVTVILLIFGLMIVAAGTIQVNFAQIGIFSYGGLTEAILDYLVTSMLFGSFLGAPLSWGAALLGIINPYWWLKTYFAWYILGELGFLP